MNKKEYIEYHRETCQRLMDITVAKNADYTGVSDDPFANFSKVEELGVASVEQGFLVRMLDKFMRINSFVQKGFLNVKDESVEDTLLDLANYCILMAGYLKSKRRSNDSQDFEQVREEGDKKESPASSILWFRTVQGGPLRFVNVQPSAVENLRKYFSDKGYILYDKYPEDKPE